MVFEALSVIIRAVMHENDHIACEFHHCNGGSWPAMQPNDNNQVAASGVIHGTRASEQEPGANAGFLNGPELCWGTWGTANKGGSRNREARSREAALYYY